MLTRRSFLKLGVVSSALLFFPIRQLLKNAAVEEEYQGRVYRGTSNGEIYVSDDQRNTWNRHINLGPQCLVTKIFSSGNDSLHAQVEFQGNDFTLSLSPDGTKWLVR